MLQALTLQSEGSSGGAAAEIRTLEWKNPTGIPLFALHDVLLAMDRGGFPEGVCMWTSKKAVIFMVESSPPSSHENETKRDFCSMGPTPGYQLVRSVFTLVLYTLCGPNYE